MITPLSRVDYYGQAKWKKEKKAQKERQSLYTQCGKEIRKTCGASGSQVVKLFRVSCKTRRKGGVEEKEIQIAF